MDDHSPGPMPSAFFIEFCGSLISDRACEPSGFDADFRKPSLCIGDQRGCDARTTRLCGDIELIEFIALYDGKSNRGAGWAYHPDIWKSCLKPVSETRQGAEPG